MATIKDPSIEALRPIFHNEFQKAFDAAENVYQAFSTEFSSSTASNTYGWMDSLSGLREQLGPKIIQSVKERSVSAVNKPFEETVGVDRYDIEDDNLGMYPALFQSMGNNAKMWKDELAAQALEANGIGFDGKAFFATDHALSGSNQSNLLSPGAGIDETKLIAAIAALRNFKDVNGKPFAHATKLSLIVPPAYEYAAKKLVSASLVPSGGGTNVLAGAADVVVNPFLTSAVAWYLVNSSAPIKPVGLQIRKEPVMVSLNKDTDLPVFMDNQYLFSTEARGVAFLTLWFTAVKSV